LEATATNTPLPYVTESQVLASAAAWAVQVIPSGDVITRFVPSKATATNTPSPYVTERQSLASAAARAVQVSPGSSAAAGDTPTASHDPAATAAATPIATARPVDRRARQNLNLESFVMAGGSQGAANRRLTGVRPGRAVAATLADAAHAPLRGRSCSRRTWGSPAARKLAARSTLVNRWLAARGEGWAMTDDSICVTPRVHSRRRFPLLATVVGAAALAAAGCVPVKGGPPPAPGGSTQPQPQPREITETFDCENASQSWVVPVGVTEADFVVVGAGGGHGGSSSPTGDGVGGKGGHTEATLAVTPHETIQINVGCRGDDGAGVSGVTAGGFGGSDQSDPLGDARGGDAGSASTSRAAGGGGGASDVRRDGTAPTDRVLVAGGGGGGGNGLNTAGGAGGHGGGGAGTEGGDGSGGSTCTGGGPGTDTAVGTGGTGCGDSPVNGAAASAAAGGAGGGPAWDPGGGGGGGWFGGGGGGAHHTGGCVGCGAKSGGGGGGSGLAGPGTTTPDVNAGDGQITITYTIFV